MAQPQAYNREVDFTERDGDDTNHAGINAELDAAALSINQIRDNLALIQRDDGGLQNGIVGADQLAQSAFDAIKVDINEAVQDAQQAAESATLAANTAISARDDAQTAETNAETAAAAALLNANTATIKAAEAAASATSAATSASTATTKASEASTSATNAAASATAAAGSATTASTQATNAANSATAAATSATNAATSASTATTQAGIATTQATNAATSATAAAASFADFNDRYLGAKSTAPTVDNDGNPLQVGTLYYDTTLDQMRVYTPTGWGSASSSVNGTSARFRYIATAGQTTFTGVDSNGNTLAYDAGFVDVYLNGSRLDQSDYTASSGTSIVLASGASVGDQLNIIAFGTFTIANLNAGQVAATDSSSGSLFTTVQGFITWVQGKFTSLASSVGSTLVGFIQSGTGAVARTAQDKMREVVSVKDFGAVGDGVTDDTAAIQAAIDYANSISASKVNHCSVYLPSGAYKASNIELKLGVKLFGDGPTCCQIVVTDTTNPCIKMNDYSHIEGVMFNYTNQTTTGTPSVYPATITNGSTTPGSYGSIKNCRAIGAYDFIVLTGCTKFLIRDCDGLPLHSGVVCDTFLDCLTIDNVHFNASFASYGATTLAWVFNNGTAFRIKRVDQPKLVNVFAFGYQYGIVLEGGAPSGSANMVEVCNFGFDICKSPIYTVNHQDGVFFSNGVVTSTSGHFGSTGLPCDIGGGVAANQHVCFTNVIFRTFYESAVFAKTNIQFDNCVFDDWNIRNINFSSPAAVFQKANNVNLQFSNCKFNLSSRAYCRGINEDGTYTGGVVTVSSCVFLNAVDREIYLPYGRLSISATEVNFSRWAGADTFSTKGNLMYVGAIPTYGAFQVGDRLYRSPPAVGQPKSWVCTVAGSPGTWVSEGNL